MNLQLREGLFPTLPRNPGDEDILEAGAVLPALRDDLIATWQQGKSGLAEEEVVQLRNWEMSLQPEDDKMLTA